MTAFNVTGVLKKHKAVAYIHCTPLIAGRRKTSIKNTTFSTAIITARRRASKPNEWTALTIY